MSTMTASDLVGKSQADWVQGRPSAPYVTLSGVPASSSSVVRVRWMKTTIHDGVMTCEGSAAPIAARAVTTPASAAGRGLEREPVWVTSPRAPEAAAEAAGMSEKESWTGSTVAKTTAC